MIGAPFSFYMALLGLLGGFAAGFFARNCNFCTLGAIEEAYYGSERSRLRTWVFALGIAIAGTQLLDLAGIVNLEQSFYLTPKLHWGGSILGGMLFGFGMALVGTCAFGMLVRAGGGDMRSLVSIMVLAIAGYTAANGILAIPVTALFDATTLSFSSVSTSAIYAFISENSLLTQTLAAVTAASIAIGWAVSSPRFTRNRAALASGTAIGLTIVYGWWITGTIGNDPFSPQLLESYRFARPIGDTLVYAMTFTGATATFSIGGVLGVILGAMTSAIAKGNFRLEAFDEPREMRRHFAGAFLMGVGAILAMGCTIGQGMSGISTLSVNSMLAAASIAVGAWLGIRYLIEGEVPSIRRTISGLWNR